MASGERVLAVRATLASGFDPVVRILTDAERYGLLLERLQVEPVDRETQTLNAGFRLAAESPLDAAQLASRFARHVGALRVVCHEQRQDAAVLEFA